MTLQHLVLLVEIGNRESRQQDVTKKTAKVTSWTGGPMIVRANFVTSATNRKETLKFEIQYCGGGEGEEYYLENDKEVYFVLGA